MAGNGWYRQEKGIAALLQSDSIAEASQLCGISTRTFTRWMQDDTFRESLRQARQQLLESAIDRLRHNAGGFVQVLVEVAQDKISPPSARVAAAKTGLQIAIDVGEVENIRKRLIELEQKTINAKPTWSSTP
jgi:hypothetical protein